MGEQLKYKAIMDWIKQEISEGTLLDGSKIPSESGFMSKFGVSRQTVRHGISKLVDEGILESRRGSGTYVTDSRTKKRMKRTKTKKIAVMTTYVNDYIFPHIIKSIEEALFGAGYTMHLTFTYNSMEKEKEILEEFLGSNNIDGLIAEPVKSNLPNPNLELYERLMRKGLKVLQINTFYEGLDAPHISIDDVSTGRMATDYLLRQGHRKIGGIFKSDDGQGSRRYMGYTQALMEAGIKIKDSRIAWIDTEDLRGSLENFIRVVKRVENCTACVCYNDEVAIKLMDVCRLTNIKIPDKLSVIGIDNSGLFKHVAVPITSINNPVNEIGKLAAEGILKMIHGGIQENIELMPEVIGRASSL